MSWNVVDPATSRTLLVDLGARPGELAEDVVVDSEENPPAVKAADVADLELRPRRASSIIVPTGCPAPEPPVRRGSESNTRSFSSARRLSSAISRSTVSASSSSLTTAERDLKPGARPPSPRPSAGALLRRTRGSRHRLSALPLAPAPSALHLRGGVVRRAQRRRSSPRPCSRSSSFRRTASSSRASRSVAWSPGRAP